MAPRLKEKPFRSAAYRKHVASLPCLICGRPSQCHHLLRAPGKGMGVKSGDNWSICLCPEHHTALHLHGDERAYLAQYEIDGPAWASKHYEQWKDGR